MVTKKLWLLPFLFVCGLLPLTGGSCDTSENGVVRSNSIEQRQTSTEGVLLETELRPVIEALCRGQVEQAEQMLEEQKDSGPVAQIKMLFRQYDRLQEFRLQEKQKAYQEQMEELEKIKEKAAAREVPDVNDIDETMLAVIRAREVAQEQQKEELLKDPFVINILDQMQQKADADEEAGEWLEAYAHNYYWLAALYEDNHQYKEKAEELTELAGLELALIDSSCAETAVERYEEIKPEMFLRALNLLDNNYVNVIDYSEMARAGLKRCRLLGQVLAKNNKEIAWEAPADAVQEWASGIGDIQTQIDQDAGEQITMQIQVLAGIFDNVLALNSVTLRLPEEVVIAQFAEASLASLDPYTIIVWPWNVKDYEKSMTQQFTGIGVEISKATGVLKISSLLPDTPAYRSGLDADDEIVAVNGESTEKMTIFCAVSKITGPKGTKVTLTILRPSTDETKDYTITRDKIVVDPLRGWTRDAEGRWDYMIDPDNGIGYVRLMQFTENSGSDLDEVLKKIEKKGMVGLILDLRFNTGGYLQVAADVVDLFVKEGVIVKSNPRYGFATYEIAHRSGTHPDYPLVILINGSSASASEIVAGALQDPKHQRATLVGERSYGKGSVQNQTTYTGDGSLMKYTMAYYHLPSDQRVKNRYQVEKQGRKDWGIAPDFEVEMHTHELKKMLDIQRDNDVLFQNGHEQADGQANRHSLEETIQVDPQLAAAIMVIRSQLAAAGNTLILKESSQDEVESQ